ncbi:unnamed protein product, partial [Scytosiphon promiscuus]
MKNRATTKTTKTTKTMDTYRHIYSASAAGVLTEYTLPGPTNTNTINRGGLQALGGPSSSMSETKAELIRRLEEIQVEREQERREMQERRREVKKRQQDAEARVTALTEELSRERAGRGR